MSTNTVGGVLKTIDGHYPLARAERWDKVGLLIGDAAAPVKRALVAHEVTKAVLDEADGFEALVVYHPPLFRPLENLNFRDETVRLAARCIGAGIGVIAAHTALDNAPPPAALGDRLAQSLGLTGIEVLSASGAEALSKIVVFVPAEALEAVGEALWSAGAGHIGNYDRAAFCSAGIGAFRPLAGAKPYQGRIGKDERRDEWRLEVIVPKNQRERAVAAMKAAHPDEEVAHDVYDLVNTASPFGPARFGKIAETSLDRFADEMQNALGAPNARLVDGGRAISRVACVPGSGASFIEAAVAAGCNCLVCGDIKHHDALKAQAAGLSIVDVTHVATENAAADMLRKALEGCGIEIEVSKVSTNPFRAKGQI